MRLFNQIEAYWSKELKRYIFRDDKSFEYEGPVAYAFGGGGGGNSEVVPTGPFGPQIPSIMRLFQQANTLLDQGPPQFPSFSTVAQPGQDLQASQGGIRDFVQGQTGLNQGSINAAAGAVNTAGQNPVANAANPLAPNLQQGILQLLNSGNNALSGQGQQTLPGATGAINAATGAVQGPQQGINTSGGPTLNPAGININPTLQANLGGSGLNPFIEDTVNAATRSLTNNFQRNVLPGISDAASLAGQPGGQRQGIAEGIASGDFLNSVGDVTSQLFSQGFNRNVDVQQNALGQVGQAQGQQGQFNLATGGLNEQIRNAILGQGLQGAQLAQQGVGQGIGFEQSGVGTGTAQAGNLLQAGNQQALQQFFQGLGIIPSLQANQLSQFGAQNQSGLQQLGFNQANIDDQVNRFFFDQFAPFNALSQFQNFIGGSFGSSVGGSPNNLNFVGAQTNPFSPFGPGSLPVNFPS